MQLSRLKRSDKVGLLFIAAFVLSMSLIYLFEERFDQDLWRAQPLKRYKMVDDIIESQLLIGKTEDEVIFLLGKPNSIISKENNSFLYRLGEEPSFIKSKREQLLVVFTDEKVLKVSLAIE